jgi:nucleotide-binding universal stress UspA family protein
MAKERDREAGGAERIVVACDTTPLGCAAIDAAAALAATLDAEMVGLFVEDVDLIRMAALPFTREFGLESGTPRALDPPDIERALRLQAQQTRHAVQVRAASRSVRWAFEVARGQVVRTVLEFARESDLIVFGRPVPGAVPGPWSGLSRSTASPVRSGAGGAPAAAVIFDGSACAWRALEAAQALSRAAGMPLVLGVVAGDAEEYERLRKEARAWLAQHGVAARFLRLASRDAAEVARLVRQEPAGVLLWPDTQAGADHQVVKTLLAALGCPLVLIH